ncbi:MAG: 4-hydroxy-3-methylbut-2-enyl diphosphate reductase [Lachnospiraceae bacterium]|nr:4-hydroxy-3-methylbut-2-enyl diphosphate reductase [Lachnospiraceae bacterium]
MEIIVAKTAGFCFGVKRAVDKVYEQIAKGDKPIFTYGPIIHNEEVVKELAAKGVGVIETEEELKNLRDCVIVIRSHGVSESIYKLLDDSVEIVDATCPFVKKIHNIVRDESSKGKTIIIVGNNGHPEVEGIKGWSQNDKVFVIGSLDEADNWQCNADDEICIVSQTTFNYNKFQDIVEIISKKGYNICVVNTICNATQERQTEAKQIAKQVDAMIVIGGKNSSNTQKLFEICKKECEHTYYIQTLVDLDLKESVSIRSLGITAGASTPNNIIEEVRTNVRIKL